MDSLDFGVYRFLSRDGEARFWAGRRIVDPRVTPREIAERLGVSESGVRSRLRRLTDRGFLRDRSVLPNPSLFGKRVYVLDLPIHRSGEVDSILRDLALVEGVVFARDLMDEDDRLLRVHYLSDGPAPAARVGTLLGRLASKPASPPPRAYVVPPCEVDLTSLDWRVLRAVQLSPESSFADLAKATRLSVKTAARRYHRLIDSRACWWTHGPTSEEFPLALVQVELRTPGVFESVRRWIDGERFAWIPVAADGLGLDPVVAGGIVAGLVPADLPTALERFLRKLSSVKGVAGIHRTFALGSAIYPTWILSQTARMAQRGAVS